MHFTRITRPLEIPAGLRSITVGGATLGGSGKTPLAIALAKCAASFGARVALVSHVYKAVDGRARWVCRDDMQAGDEAIASAIALHETGARVVAATRRQDAIDLASDWAQLLVIDGPLQIAPRRADWSVLAVDRQAPWGSGACPPLGDLRAPRQTLLATADTVVHVRTDLCDPMQDEAAWHIDGALGVNDGRWRSLDELRHEPRVLVTNLARPERLVRTLAAHGVTVTRHVDLADHSRESPSHVKYSDCLTTHKTRQAMHWPRAAWIEARLVLSEALVSKVRTLTTTPF
jgi:tetraacyldisaccharide 4'-kinase